MPPRRNPGPDETAKAGTPAGPRAAANSATGASSNGSREQTPSAQTQMPAGAMAQTQPRVVIEGVRPEVDGGRYPAKCAVGENAAIEADIYTDSHEEIAADVLYRRDGETAWTVAHMQPLGNDRWRAEFRCAQLATYVFTIVAWVDHFARWQQGLAKKVDAGQDVSVDLLVGAQLIDDAVTRAPEKDAQFLRNASAKMSGGTAAKGRTEAALSVDLAARMRDLADKGAATQYPRELRIQVGPKLAAFSSWYEIFVRSASPDPSRPGTFRDVEQRLEYVAQMGFDVLYLTPVHPIGKAHRKGPNNSISPGPHDPGSPWAIGSELGGHKAINPDLGTLEDFRRLVRKAQDRGIHIAMDIAFQASPDHPYVKEHPEWFKQRPDGTVQYAENPPKKYEDIYPFNFETPAWESLWEELKSVFLYWMEQGVRVFRVDNPHTKPFAFWEWCIGEVHRVDPGVIFLAEAFTRPKIMYHLAKIGFTQSYTYFAWRYNKWELTDYFTEVSRSPVADFFRPNVWPNTPDILTEQMQTGGRPVFTQRLVLAATLSANYGIYGPPYELMEHTAIHEGNEEYLNSEKYQVRHWDIERADSLRELISLVNAARRDNPALHTNAGLRFHSIENDNLIAYSKQTDDAGNVIVCVVNLDPAFTQSGWLELPIGDWGIAHDEPYQVHDLLSDARFTWQGARNFVQLNPNVIPAHIFLLRKRTGGSGWEFE